MLCNLCCLNLVSRQLKLCNIFISEYRIGLFLSGFDIYENKSFQTEVQYRCNKTGLFADTWETLCGKSSTRTIFGFSRNISEPFLHILSKLNKISTKLPSQEVGHFLVSKRDGEEDFVTCECFSIL